MVSKSTEDDYIKTGERFFKNNLEDRHLSEGTPIHLYEAFDALSLNASPRYWRKNRLALAFYFNEQGYHDLADVLSPDSFRNNQTQTWDIDKQAWVRNEKGRPGQKQNRCKKVSEQEAEKLFAEAGKRKNKSVMAALYLAWEFGCRPIDMPKISQVSDNQFYIPPSKQISEGINAGKRGLGRYIKVVSENKARNLSQCVKLLKNVNMTNIEKLVCQYSKSIWPNRKSRPSLYSIRHQFGSDLKSSGYSRIEVAYLMGHQCTSSVDSYGDRRSGRANDISIEPAISIDEIKKLVRVDHLSEHEIKENREGRAKQHNKTLK